MRTDAVGHTFMEVADKYLSFFGSHHVIRQWVNAIEFMQHPLLHMGLGVPFRVDVICGWTQINLVENYGRSVTVFISGLH